MLTLERIKMAKAQILMAARINGVYWTLKCVSWLYYVNFIVAFSYACGSKTTNSGQQLALQRARNTRVKPIVPDDNDENTSDAEERAATLKGCGVNGVYENLIISVRLERVDLSPNSKTKSELSSDGFRVRRLRHVSIVPQEAKKLVCL
jgi:hypothetical protein